MIFISVKRLCQAFVYTVGNIFILLYLAFAEEAPEIYSIRAMFMFNKIAWALMYRQPSCDIISIRFITFTPPIKKKKIMVRQPNLAAEFVF